MTNSEKNINSNSTKKMNFVQMGVGVALGIALGAALHNIALGLVSGILVGGLGVIIDKSRKSKLNV